MTATRSASSVRDATSTTSSIRATGSSPRDARMPSPTIASCWRAWRSRARAAALRSVISRKYTAIPPPASGYALLSKQRPSGS